MIHIHIPRSIERFIKINAAGDNFEVAFPVIFFDIIPINNTCLSDTSYKLFVSSIPALIGVLRHIDNDKAYTYIDILKRIQNNNNRSQIQQIINYQSGNNTFPVSIKSISGKPQIPVIIEEKTKRQIKTSIELKTSFIKRIKVRLTEENRDNNPNNIKRRLISKSIDNVKKCIVDQTPNFEQLIVLCYLCSNNAIEDIIKTKINFNPESIGLKNTLKFPIILSNSRNGTKTFREKGIISKEIFDAEDKDSKNLISNWENSITKTGDIKNQIEDIIDFIFTAHVSSSDLHKTPSLIQQIFNSIDLTKAESINNIFYNHINFLVQIILTRIHFFYIDRCEEAKTELPDYLNESSVIEHCLSESTNLNKDSCIINELYQLYIQVMNKASNEDHFNKIKSDILSIWGNLTGGYYEHGGDISHEHFDELLYLSTKPGIFFQNYTTLSITLPNVSEILFPDYEPIKKHKGYGLHYLFTQEKNINSPKHISSENISLPIEIVEKKYPSAISNDDSDATSVITLDEDYSNESTDDYIDEETLKEIYGDDYKNAIAAEKLYSCPSNNMERIEINGTVLQGKITDNEIILINRLKKDKIYSHKADNSRTDKNMEILSILIIAVISSIALAFAAIYIPPLMSVLNFGILGKITLMDGIPIIQALLLILTILFASLSIKYGVESLGLSINNTTTPSVSNALNANTPKLCESKKTSCEISRTESTVYQI